MDRDSQIDDRMTRILDLKEEANRILEELDSEKTTLFNYMIDKDIKKYESVDGKASIISFTKESLKTQDTLLAIEQANRYRKFINKAELINRSYVGFVLVKENE